jgi:hypothetical protein
MHPAVQVISAAGDDFYRSVTNGWHLLLRKIEFPFPFGTLRR